MTEVEVQIPNRLGLHARAAARFVHLANSFESRVVVRVVDRDGVRIDGKSILGLLTLAACCGTRLRIAADGKDEAGAIAELVVLIESGFGEGLS